MSAAGEDDSAKVSPADATRKPCQLIVYDRKGEVVGLVTADTFMAFKRKCGRHTAIIVELACGQGIFVDTCKLIKKLPRGATYRARLLQRTSAIPDELAREASGHDVWVEA